MKLRSKKTGEIVDVDFGKIYESIKSTSAGPKPSLKPEDVLEKFGYDTLAELNAEWEDYKPAKPLIKDEKVRKAVRAWAEACDVERVYLSLENEDESTFCVYKLQVNCNFIQIATHDHDPIGGGRAYTIAELCGEEQPTRQYTTLKDKNGKEVYKGDIVRFGNEIEIIDNINLYNYENPELLGEDEEC